MAEWRDELDKRSVLSRNAGAAEPRPSTPVASSVSGRKTDPRADPKAATPEWSDAVVRPTTQQERPARGEPTESEMYDLLRAKFAAVAEQIQEMKSSCRGGYSQNDPGKAVLCLMGGLGGVAGADEPLKITRFEKLGCERANGKPGYVCDYLIATSGRMHDALGPSMAAIAGRGGAGQARFLQSSSGWIAFFGEKR
jgi:hypothetical protein